MLVAAIVSVSTAIVIAVLTITVIALLVAVIRARSAPNRRRRQSETAARLFDDSATSAWSNNDSEQWSSEQREAALTYYNTAGRRARIGGLRADLIPDNHRSHIQRLADSVADDDETRAKWSDFLWLAARVDKQSATSRSNVPQSATEEHAESSKSGDSGDNIDSDSEVTDLATVLGLNGSPIDIDEIEQGAEQTTPAAAGESADGQARAVANGTPDNDSTPDVGDNPEDKASSADETPTGTSEPDANAEEQSLLPNVPAWILEARAALPVSQTPHPADTGTQGDADSGEPKPILAGTDFSWPRVSPALPVEGGDDVGEPIDFIPDIDVGELAATDNGSLAEPDSDLAGADPQRGADSPDRTDTSAVTVEDGVPEQDDADKQDDVPEQNDAPDLDDVAEQSRTEPAGPVLEENNVAEEPRTEPAVPADEDPIESQAGPGPHLDSSVEEARLDEIRRLKRKAKKARRKSEQSSRLTLKYAREGRRKKARMAANIALDQADLAKRLKKRVRRLERSIKD